MTEHVRRYEVGGLIAQGGMAEIVAACAVSEAGVVKRVALKRIRTDRSADPTFVARFFDEARLAMQLSHANIVQVFDFGRTEEDEFFLAMEFVEGVDLQRLRHEKGHQRLPPAEALHLVAQALRGLDYAHRRADDAGQPLGIVHLDVKPANVLLSFEGEVKLTDFGVARSRDARRPELGISGTIPFMSPEQARGEKLDVRSDVFSAGVVLYALLTGNGPFGESDTERTLERVRAGVWAPTRAAVLDPLLSRALHPSPDQRYPTAGAFADAIEELLYAQGWRSGAAALAERLRAAFPGERERLASLFAPGAIAHGLAVAGPAHQSGGTLLSRIPDAEPPRRQTILAAPPTRSRWPAILGVSATVGALGLGGTYLFFRPALGAQPDAALEVILPGADASPAGADAATPLAEPPDASGPDAASAAPVRPPRPLMGTLTVNATPWGQVLVNGELAGTTPLIRFPVRAGNASVTIENPKLGRRVVTVKILPNRDLPLFVDLRPAGEPK